MTDNEIIKALERCPQHRECCYCNSVEECGNKRVLTTNALDLINRQKAEIERLKEELDGETVKNMRLGHKIERLKAVSEICGECHKQYAEKIEQAKFEARKEFAERLKKVMVTTRKDINGYCHYETEDYYIDNLLKETEG